MPVVPSQVGSAAFSKGAKNDQRLINQMAFGLPVIIYSGYSAFADDADDMWCASQNARAPPCVAPPGG